MADINDLPDDTDQQKKPRYAAGMVLKLIRFHQPVGTLLLMWPPLWCLLLLTEDWPPIDLMVVFILGAFIMRSAGCVINDITDRKLDAKVERTKTRPLASGEMPLTHAFVILVLLLLIALIIAIYLGPKVVLASIPAVLLVILYPWMKRITFWPQLCLGLTFNYGVLLASIALTGGIHPTAWWLYAAAVCWTLGYDTIYGFQDIKDDEKIGVKSTARLFKHRPQLAVGAMYGLAAIGLYISAGVLPAALFAVHCLWQVGRLQIDDSELCKQLFKRNGTELGLIIWLSILFTA